MLSCNRKMMQLKVGCRIQTCVHLRRTRSASILPQSHEATPVCAGLQDPPDALQQLAARIVGVIEGDVGPSGGDGLVASLTDGVLVRALQALEAALGTSGRVVASRRLQRYLTWLVRDALGVQKAVEGGVAQSTGARLLKQAQKVRAADAMRDADASTAALAKPYPEPGAPPLPWEEPAAPAESAQVVSTPPAPPTPPEPPAPPALPAWKGAADYITDYRPRAFTDASRAFLDKFFFEEQADGPSRQMECWAPDILAWAAMHHNHLHAQVERAAAQESERPRSLNTQHAHEGSGVANKHTART